MISLTSFLLEEFHAQSTLNPLLWDGGKLRPEVRSALLRFAEAWRDYAHIPPNTVKDILLVGGNAGYLWTPHSDVDVHLLVDRAALGKRELVDDLMKSKKKLWALEHHVTINGLPVEPYAQDLSEITPVGQGSYSILRDEWVAQPNKEVPDYSEDRAFNDKVQHYRDLIDHMIENNAPLSDFRTLRERIGGMRKTALSLGGEHAQENLVFKSLRNMGALDRMSKHMRDREDQELSLG